MITAYVGVGTNIEREKHAQVAVVELAELGIDMRVSTVYECEAVGFDAPAFYNFVVELKTDFSLTEFSRALRTIELRWGRAENARKFENRTVDLDILMFGEQESMDKPVLPRRDIFVYAFVIQPLYELCPERVVPGDGRTIDQIWRTQSDVGLLKAVTLPLLMNEK